VCKIIIKIQAKFFWGWGYEERKVAWFAWDKVCSPFKVVGLDIKDIDRFNTTLLAKWKWKWRLGMEEDRVRRDIIESRYGS